MNDHDRNRSGQTGEAGPGPAFAAAEVPAVDGLRGLAALLVLLFHCWVFVDAPLDRGVLRAFVASGALGVDFFFVISGFVLFLPVALRGGHFGDVRGYLVRRMARIAPAYYLSLVVQALLVRTLTGFPSPFSTRGGLLVFVSHLLFLQHQLPASLARAAGFWGNVVGFGVNGVVWSLSIEALFYVTLPLVAAAFFRRPAAGLLLAIVASLGWRIVALHVPALIVEPASGAPGAPRLLDQYPAFLAHFALGMYGALVYVRAARGPSWGGAGTTLLLAQLAVVTALVATMIGHGLDLERAPLAFARELGSFVPALAFATLLTLAAIAPSGALRCLTWPRARWLGDVSYGVFLWHLPLILLVRRQTSLVIEKSDASFLLLCALVLPASLLIGWLSRRFVEEPAIRWARRRSARR